MPIQMQEQFLLRNNMQGEMGASIPVTPSKPIPTSPMFGTPKWFQSKSEKLMGFPKYVFEGFKMN
jgi:hypothetical protein